MRIPIICAVLAALFGVAIYMTGDSSKETAKVADHHEATEKVEQHGQVEKATPQTIGSAVAAKQDEAEHGNLEVPEHGEQMDHAVKMAHGMAAQHAMHDQAVQKATGQEHKVHWGYRGDGAPEKWGQLAAEYAMCGSGLNQSPVNLVGFVEAELAPLKLNYAGMAVKVVNNGHTIKADYHPGSNLVVDGRIFHLKQFHFHAPSENLINGQSYPLEVHFVHADANGNLAVVAVMFEDGEANKAIEELWSQMPENTGGEAVLRAAVKATDLLPESRDYYRFNGSLTTPPCSQGVIWLVMKQPLAVSQGQVHKFASVMGGPNNRPVQPLNARTILQ